MHYFKLCLHLLNYNLQVSQISCYDANLAPDSCTQYFTGVTGTIQSFNYQSAAGLQLSKTDYTICIRMERNFCGIQYTPCSDTGNREEINDI